MLISTLVLFKFCPELFNYDNLELVLVSLLLKGLQTSLRGFIKGTECVNSCDSPCKDDNARFTTVPFKALSDQVRIIYQCFCFIELFIFIYGFSVKVNCAFLAYKKQRRNSQNKIKFSSQKNEIFFQIQVSRDRCKSGIAIFVKRNNASSPFQFFFSGGCKAQYILYINLPKQTL